MKIKKAFCEPGNIGFCPPIAIASTFCFWFSPDGAAELVVKRSQENGGDAVYKNRADIEADFASGALHPGDLKAAATTVILSVIEKLAAGIKQDSDAMKASKTLKAFQKKMAKRSKK